MDIYIYHDGVTNVIDISGVPDEEDTRVTDENSTEILDA